VSLVESGTIIVVHSLRNRLFLPEHGLAHVPLMVSAFDLIDRPILRRCISRVGIKRHLKVKSPVFIDSGGFSISQSRAARIDLSELLDIYHGLNADFYAALDVPPGIADSSTRRQRKWAQTLSYLERMMPAVDRRKLIPVVHGRNMMEVENACLDVRDRMAGPRVVALGGMVPFLRGMMSRDRFSYRRKDGSVGHDVDFVGDALGICRSTFPNSRIHVFGVGSPTTAITLLAVGADSVDSLAWRRAAGYGTIFLRGCSERIVSVRERRHSSRPLLSSDERQKLALCGCPICRRHTSFTARLNSLAKSYVTRGVHNVWTLLAEQQELRAAKYEGKIREFLDERLGARHRLTATVTAFLAASANEMHSSQPALLRSSGRRRDGQPV
jgi:tRNA-guanine family transglycosylase